MPLSPLSIKGPNLQEKGDKGDVKPNMKHQRSLNRYRFRQALSLNRYKDHISNT